jgi:hypothetical protein
MKILVLGLTLLFTAGCASLPFFGGGGPFGDITQLTVTDLEAALADATAHNDLLAMQCYPALIQIVQDLPEQAPPVEIKGIVSAFQATRNLAKKAQQFSVAGNAMTQQVNLACAALFNDAKGDILRLAIKFRP